MVFAQEEARTLKHDHVGTEHILLGLLREEEGVAARVLRSFEITVDRVRAQVVRVVGSGEEVTSGQIPFTLHAKKVLELALREGLSLGHDEIGTEHMLLGLVRENEGVAARILLGFDADSEKIRNEVMRTLSGTGGRSGVARPRSGIDSTEAVMPDPTVPEGRRFCAHCDEPIGRERDGAPGRATGFCPKCGTGFSFEPKLKAGDVVVWQYEVVGCIAHGGMGWVYLARDRNVSDRWVVLKGLLNAGDDDAMAAALAERRFLAEVEHPNIVKIFNFVQHESSGYIVTEYVRGENLKQILRARRDANGGDPDPLPPAQAAAYMLEILPALGYLHDRGLLFCDFKPDNVIRTPHSLKLIDLGGVYRLDEPSTAWFGTVGYVAPEIATTGPSIPSDLFAVARTLAVLCFDFRGYQSNYRYTLPDAKSVPVLARYDSLYRFLLKGTAVDPDDRFQSADEMAEQLRGVRRQIVADEDPSR